MPNRAANIQDVIDRAQAYVGFTSAVNRVNNFGQKAGYNGKPWSGSFLETVFREAGCRAGVTLTSTVTALGWFTRHNQIFHVPKIGDIAFFGWSTQDDGFGQPHVGLVTDVSDWKTLGKFRTVEGNTDSGMPKGSGEANGVFDRTRYAADVLAFARPTYAVPQTVTAPLGETKPLHVAQLQPGKANREVELLQSALAERLDIKGFHRGKFDAHTRSAVAAFQRENGMLNPTGVPDEITLRWLSEQTAFRWFQ